MNKTTKRLIAREGLTILSIIVIAILMFTAGSMLQKTVVTSDPTIIKSVWRFGQGLQDWSSVTGILGYPAYLLIRFILWAIRALREK